MHKLRDGKSYNPFRVVGVLCDCGMQGTMTTSSSVRMNACRKCGSDVMLYF